MDDQEDSPALYKEKLWDQLDNLQQRFLKSDNEEQELEPTRSTYKKPDKNKKLHKIKMYQDALDRHRKTNNSYWCPTDPVKLKVNQTECIKMLKESLQDQQKMPAALRNVGLKRVKILFRCGAIEHVNTMIKYLQTGEMPTWISARYKELVRRRKYYNSDESIPNYPSNT